MFDPELRVFVSRTISKPVSKIPVFVGPNMISFTGLIVGLACPVMILQANSIVALLLFSANRILDSFDGNLARHRKNESLFGQAFDLGSDFFIYAAIPLAISIENGSNDYFIVTALLIASYYVNAGIMLSSTNVTNPESRGLIEGFETIIFYFVIILFPNDFVIVGSIFAFLVGLTSILRLVKLHRQSRELG